ncbi:RNA polymerase sigma factor [Filimonas effusa]|uniref:Sigma-70 family RNA polymerase sigma factor n=1 Tax=Filimonas effusa TaxID=2508721 RepID=A0A4Q1DDM7_9BACT|nr:sigma-70 family RNA polymerase sigma factor [Filimonas effusa]RXK86679.1 sigma-70 family RNA polymerase sigma factor [Filimonas effusa]
MNKASLAHISDQELLDRFYQSGENEWLGYLLQRYTMLLLGVCMKYLKNEEEAKDSVQQVFLKVITEIRKYKVEYFKSWLYMVARNHCLMRLRDKHGKIPQELDESMIVSDTSSDKSSLQEKEQILDLVNTALPLLNKEQKTCVTLFYLEKKSYQEICDITGYTALQVKSHIQNGKRNIKLLVEKKMKEK